MQLLIWASMYAVAVESACFESTHPNLELDTKTKKSTVSYPKQHYHHGSIGQSLTIEMISKYKLDVQKQTVEESSEEY